MSLAFTPVCLSAQAPGAKETVRLFLKAIRERDEDAALNCLFVPPGSDARARVEIAAIMRRSKIAQAEPAAQVSKESGTVAVVIMKDGVPNDRGKPDYDTVFFLKRAGEWRMVIDFLIKTNQDDPITAEERATMAELTKWADTKRAELER